MLALERKARGAMGEGVLAPCPFYERMIWSLVLLVARGALGALQFSMEPAARLDPLDQLRMTGQTFLGADNARALGVAAGAFGVEGVVNLGELARRKDLALNLVRQEYQATEHS